MNSNSVFFWACDYENTTGEGRLARLFIKKYKEKFKKVTYKIQIPKSKILNKKYISPFFGVCYAWLYFFQGKNFLFLNYLPYWNFFIFLMLPPKCEIGPITGGAKFSKKSDDYLIRKLLFPILYFLTSLVLKFRYRKLIFSTDLLKNFLPKSIIKKSKFNFIFYEIIKKKRRIIKNKSIQLLFYYRKHKNKDYKFTYKIINQLNLDNLKTHIVGDRLNLSGVKNHGFVSHSKVIKLLRKTKYSIVSSENIFTFFTIDCINNDVKLLVNKKMFKSIHNYKNNFELIDFNKNNINKLIKR